MKKRLSWLLTVALMLTLVLPAGAMASGANAAAGQGLEKIAAEKAALLTEKYGTVSVQYALIDNGKITVSGQAGKNDMEGKKPLTKDTVYAIGSTSKVFTAAAVMKLVEDGKIDLDAPVVQYIPDFTMKDERYKKITPRMLLNHSSGLNGSSLSNAFLFNDNDTYAHDTLLKQLSTQSLKADPGAFSVYCNDGFTLAEILVERVSNMSFSEFVRQNFIKPLEMNHTKTSQETLEPSKMAGLYFPTVEGQLPNETVNVIGTGGIYSTAEDLARFSTLFTGQAKGILSGNSVKAMEQEEYKKGLWPKDSDNSVNYGLGWDSVKLFPFNEYGMKGLTKGGDTILYHASLVVLPEQNMAAAVLSSGGSSSTNQMLASEILLHALKEKGTIKEFKPEKSFGKPVKADMPNDLMQKAGYYATTNNLVKISVSKDGELTVSVPSMPGYPQEKYVYTKDGSFVTENGSGKLSIVTEKNGRTYLWASQYMSVPGLGQTALSHYLAEKIEDNKLDKETAAAWAKRDGRAYYPVTEKYSSLMYLIMNPVMQISRLDDFQGYVGDKKITGPDTAVSQHQIPAMGGRDTFELRFNKEGGTEYLEAAGILYISGDKVKPLHNGKKSTVTLQDNGHARWYTVPEGAAGKTMTVTMPAKGAFAVYNEQGVCVNYSIATGKNTVELPKNGTVVFAGESGSSFGITLK
ncbi:serine hydrolase domain-containing protein [Paenibacillus sp. DMB20]|uniref:serine hydrolase domain-containing protein n=1 Tax=Paenibacillus sp. DMB20 TaxID=1642570 RepID=UPI000627A601|nr:serine hydrolase domain-containing protein [Paenibacillus sp. DMB20]KKO55202.1 beta-lactamase [Paenibacillus sp. DMB20]